MTGRRGRQPRRPGRRRGAACPTWRRAPGAFDLQPAAGRRAGRLTDFGVYVLGIEVVGAAATPRRTRLASRCPHAAALVAGDPGSAARPASAGCGRWWAPRSGWPTAPSPTTALAASLRPAAGWTGCSRPASRSARAAAVPGRSTPTCSRRPPDMADGYDSRSPPRTAAAHRAPAAAGAGPAWLDAAAVGDRRRATCCRCPTPTPTWSRDRGTACPATSPGPASRPGPAVLAALLARRRPSSSDVAWPADGYLDRDTLGALARGGVTARRPGRPGAARHRSTSATPPPAGARLPSTSGPVAALLADPALADLLGAAPAGAAGSALRGAAGASPRPR